MIDINDVANKVDNEDMKNALPFKTINIADYVFWRCHNASRINVSPLLR